MHSMDTDTQAVTGYAREKVEKEKNIPWDIKTQETEKLKKDKVDHKLKIEEISKLIRGSTKNQADIHKEMQ